MAAVCAALLGAYASEASLTRVRKGTAAKLGKLGEALLQYKEVDGAYPVQGFASLEAAGYITDASLFLAKGDPYPQGYANAVAECQSGLYPVAPHPSSVEISFAGDVWLSIIRPSTSNPGLMLVRIYGSRQKADRCGERPMEFQGRTVRLNEDGGTKEGWFSDVDKTGRRSACWPAMYTDVPVREICSRS